MFHVQYESVTINVRREFVLIDALKEVKRAHHNLRSERNYTPMQLWIRGIQLTEESFHTISVRYAFVCLYPTCNYVAL